ncbi:MAG TPA: hypothetical protein DCS07_16375 [Bdellovibrionales bacterium]|nr:MAG: hypothetical protein A2Z97_16595 [Bdellovibrionales bacterium GWB1_52_6]OFZ05083.1 MAG: hypothetical protein A2X97_00635 [Bdellovibrionales bacterium GWA1_52_35]OFZ40574.1 MAG: hypothetical protein A2070_11255 [Bdellovibrionales bacterium GWC1_52_8]HAR44181.1 hypothetical protein [Bdellovibrionales bacterium]HCM41321.1 hypothetical protein [Bdellovibrionales bacterium]
MSKIYKCSFEVRGYELDSFGHVNNAVYLRYLEHARWKMLEEEGITLKKIRASKRWPVISRVEISYKRPLFMGDAIEIETRIVSHQKASFTIEQRIFRQGTLVSDAKLKSVVVDETGRPVGLPEEFLQLGRQLGNHHEH